MFRSALRFSLLVGVIAGVWMTTRARADNPKSDWGTFVQDLLHDHSEQLFGIRHPLEKSALGPYDAADNLKAIEVADGLSVSLVSSSVPSAADQIAFWPDDEHPTHLFICGEETTNPAV